MKIKKIGLTKYNVIEAKCMHQHIMTDVAGITTCKDCWHKFNSDRMSYDEIKDAVKIVIDAIETAKLAVGANVSASANMVNRVQQISCAIPMIENLPGIYTASIEAFLNAEKNTTENTMLVTPLTQDDIKMLRENKRMES